MQRVRITGASLATVRKRKRACAAQSAASAIAFGTLESEKVPEVRQAPQDLIEAV